MVWLESHLWGRTRHSVHPSSKYNCTYMYVCIYIYFFFYEYIQIHFPTISFQVHSSWTASGEKLQNPLFCAQHCKAFTLDIIKCIYCPFIIKCVCVQTFKNLSTGHPTGLQYRRQNWQCSPRGRIQWEAASFNGYRWFYGVSDATVNAPTHIHTHSTKRQIFSNVILFHDQLDLFWCEIH